MKYLVLFVLNVLIFNTMSGQKMWSIESLNKINRDQLSLKPNKYQLIHLDENFFHIFQNEIPSESESSFPIMQLPNPLGELEDFYVFECPMMETALAKKYASIKTYTAVRVGLPYITAKLDFTNYGFHAKVFNGDNTYFIDPALDYKTENYISYFKKDYPKPLTTQFECLVNDDEYEAASEVVHQLNQAKTHGTQKREYRLALACTGEYAVAVAGASPTVANVHSKLVTSINRINGVFEREFAVHLNMIANNDTLIYLDGTTDPYTNNSGSTMLNENQLTIDARVGSTNYDMGHVFSTGGGGIAQLGCICGSSKAKGVTGLPNPQGDAFDIDYVAHEMGHQFNCNHTFDATTGSCSGNRSKNNAFEVGSATTIMGYAGICDVNDIQLHSDDYYHAKSGSAFSTFITTGAGNNCPLTTTLTTVPPTLNTPSATYNIPYKTPFELTANATGASSNALTYCWEEWDFSNTNSGNDWDDKVGSLSNAPFIRSFNPDTSATRVFPRIDSLIKQNFWYKGERLADTQRTLRFKTTVRSFNNGLGAFNFMDDSIKLFTYPTTDFGSFTVTYPSTAGVSVNGNDLVTLTWNVNGTNTGNVNCANVDIYFSIDGGRSFPYLVKSNTPNDGSEQIYVPNITSTTKGRFKVKGNGNVFFNISKYDMNITQVAWPLGLNTIDENNISIYPNPASNNVEIKMMNNDAFSLNITNALGEVIYKANTQTIATINTATWAKGIYFVQLETKSKKTGIKKLIIE